MLYIICIALIVLSPTFSCRAFFCFVLVQAYALMITEFPKFLKYSNEYISVVCIDTSNIAGGEIVKGGKQWSIIMDIKKPFYNRNNWKILKNELGDDIKITPLRYCKKRQELNGKSAIRIYKKGKDPTTATIKRLLDFIFEND